MDEVKHASGVSGVKVVREMLSIYSRRPTHNTRLHTNSGLMEVNLDFWYSFYLRGRKLSGSCLRLEDGSRYIKCL